MTERGPLTAAVQSGCVEQTEAREPLESSEREVLSDRKIEDEPATVTVESWRPEPLALPAGPTPVAFDGPDYVAPGDGGRLPLYVPSEILDRNGHRL